MDTATPALIVGLHIEFHNTVLPYACEPIYQLYIYNHGDHEHGWESYTMGS